jgi:hypothetical protein
MCVCFWGSFCGYDFKKISLKKVWLVGFKYMFGKNCGWGLCATKKYI